LNPYISGSYRKLSLKYHADRNKEITAQENFAAVAEAYDVLSTSAYKATYDRYGAQGLTQGAPDAGSGFTRPYVFHGDAIKVFQSFWGTENPFQDLFPMNDEYGLSAQHELDGQRTRKTQDGAIERDLFITMEEAYLGCVKKMKMNRKVLSDDGYTTVPKDKLFTIHVAPGWKQGTRITFPKDGDQGPNNIPADVVFVIKYKPHARFVREGNNLVHTCEISLLAALSGFLTSLVTLDARKLSLPVFDLVRPGYEMKVPGEGMIVAKGTVRGDLIIRFKITFPSRNLNPEQIGFLKQAFATE